MQIALPLDEKSSIPLYRQVVAGIQSMIEKGALAPGARLPATRELAEHLGISRFTASQAYDELLRLGYIETISSVGTFVSRSRKGAAVKPNRPEESAFVEPEVNLEGLRLSSYGSRMMTSHLIESAGLELFEELNYCAPSPEQIPIAKWQELLVRCSRHQELDVRTYTSDVFGHEELRCVLADYLKRVRCVRATPEQICIFSGAQPALDMITRLIVNEGDRCFVENPGFPGARRTFASYGGSVSPVPVDDSGMVVERLIEESAEGKIAYLTPSHHDPTGVVLSPARRKLLLGWAQRNSVWIVEDDFDSEFRYNEKPVPSLQSQDESESVIYLSSFWKVMFPVVRIGFIVVPPRLVAVLRKSKALAERDFHFVEHEALALFIKEGHLERHVRRTRRLYTQKRAALIAMLNANFGKRIKIFTVSAGTHLLVRLNTDVPDDRICRAAQAAGLPLVPMAAYHWNTRVDREFLMPFGHIDEKEIEDAVARFLEICPL